MAIYVLTPGHDSMKRSDRRNLFLISASSAALAKDRAEQMCGDVDGVFDNWNATALTGSGAQDFTVECSGPVGLREGTAWPHLTAGGSPLAI